MHTIQRKSPGTQVQLSDELLVKVQGFVNLDGNSDGTNGTERMKIIRNDSHKLVEDK